jgi:hypothetical protein
MKRPDQPARGENGRTKPPANPAIRIDAGHSGEWNPELSLWKPSRRRCPNHPPEQPEPPERKRAGHCRPGLLLAHFAHASNHHDAKTHHLSPDGRGRGTKPTQIVRLDLGGDPAADASALRRGDPLSEACGGRLHLRRLGAAPPRRGSHLPRVVVSSRREDCGSLDRPYVALGSQLNLLSHWTTKGATWPGR